MREKAVDDIVAEFTKQVTYTETIKKISTEEI